MRSRLVLSVFALGLCAAVAAAQEPAVSASNLEFVAISPCRLADTRGNGFIGPFGPPSLLPLAARVFPVAGNCGIPVTAQV
ncbi:MAG: hypothetical protein DMF79_16435, partial [Acidobacteria bacterium]